MHIRLEIENEKKKWKPNEKKQNKTKKKKNSWAQS